MKRLNLSSEESAEIKIMSDLLKYLKTFGALVCSYRDEKLQKHIIEAYAESLEETHELIGKENADDIIIFIIKKD